MYKTWLAIAMMFVIAGCGTAADSNSSGSEFDAYAAYTGFVDLYWDEAGGRLLIRIKELDEPVSVSVVAATRRRIERSWP